MNNDMMRFVKLEDRGLLRLGGADARTFLQGLVSNDIKKLAPDRAIHAALLSPQGKYLHDFFLTEGEDGLYLDCEAARRDDLKRRLSVYRLRSKVEIVEVEPGLAVFALFGSGANEAVRLEATPGAARPFAGGIAYVDPRLAAAGVRANLAAADAEPALQAAGFTAGRAEEYERVRLGLGLPDGSRDIDVDKTVLLEAGFEELNGVDFSKGCYLGQEVTARTKYRGLIKKRLLPVTIDGAPPPRGAPLLMDDTEVGEMRSSCGDLGLALVRLDRFAEATAQSKALTAEGSRIIPHKPDWMAL